MIKVVLKGHDFRYEVGELIKVFGLFKEICFVEDRDIIDNDEFLLSRMYT